MTTITNASASKTLKAAGFTLIEAQHTNNAVKIKHFDDFIKMAKEVQTKFVFATPIYLTKNDMITGRDGHPVIAERNQKIKYFMENPIDIIYSFVYEGIWYSHTATFADVSFVRDKKEFINNIPYFNYTQPKDFKTYPSEL